MLVADGDVVMDQDRQDARLVCVCVCVCVCACACVCVSVEVAHPLSLT